MTWFGKKWQRGLWKTHYWRKDKLMRYILRKSSIVKYNNEGKCTESRVNDKDGWHT